MSEKSPYPKVVVSSLELHGATLFEIDSPKLCRRHRFIGEKYSIDRMMQPRRELLLGEEVLRELGHAVSLDDLHDENRKKS